MTVTSSIQLFKKYYVLQFPPHKFKMLKKKKKAETAQKLRCTRCPTYAVKVVVSLLAMEEDKECIKRAKSAL